MGEQYDISFIRHGMEVPVTKITNMSVGERALLKTEQDESRLDRYESEVIARLGEHGENYELLRVNLDKKCGLVIKRRSI